MIERALLTVFNYYTFCNGRGANDKNEHGDGTQRRQGFRISNLGWLFFYAVRHPRPPVSVTWTKFQEIINVSFHLSATENSYVFPFQIICFNFISQEIMTSNSIILTMLKFPEFSTYSQIFHLQLSQFTLFPRAKAF